jgi:DNA-binding CsgD family transcriptional regulator
MELFQLNYNQSDAELNSGLRGFQDLLSTYTIEQRDVNYSVLDYHIPFLERLDAVDNSSVVLFDYFTGKYRFITAKFKYLIGYDRDTALEEGPEYFLKNMHPEDLPRVVDTISQTNRFLQDLPEIERRDYKLNFTFRIRNSTGAYVRLMQQVILLELDAKGNPWLALIVNDMLANKENENPFRRLLINIRDSRYYLFTPDEESGQKGLSTREIEILGLMGKGLPSKQIADQLHISINTVNNHRCSILRKLQVSNAAEAVQYAARLGITG